MSQEGYDSLVAELHELESVELPKVREAIAEARDKGDLSENFEYHAAKRAQARLLSRISFKQKVLANARVTYTIVSPHEADIHEGKISIKSPIAQALLNKKVGDVVEVRVPAGVMKLRVESINL